MLLFNAGFFGGIVFDSCKSIRRHLNFQPLQVRAQISEPLLIPFQVWSHLTLHAFLRACDSSFRPSQPVVTDMQSLTDRTEVNRDVFVVRQLRSMLNR